MLDELIINISFQSSSNILRGATYLEKIFYQDFNKAC